MDLNAFIDELEKIAVSVSQLQKGFRRLGIVRVPSPKASPTQILESLQAGERPGIGAMTHFMGGVATLPPAKGLAKATAQNRAAMYRTHKALLGKPNTEAVRAQFQASKQTKPLLVPKKSVILTSKGGPAKGFEQAMGEKFTPEGRKAINLALGHHEGFERAALKRGRIRYGFGHVNPSVLAKEHNLLATLEGPGASEARQFLQNIRASQGDAPALSQSLERMFGPRAATEFGTGAKIPKAMRKRLERSVPMDVWGRMPPQTIGL
jgi:hypothetical protein